MTALDTACPTCASQVGEECKVGPIDNWRYTATPHASRIEMAAGMSSSETAIVPSEKEFDAAVESVLF